jgi:AraC-like DNA-binding protein
MLRLHLEILQKICESAEGVWIAVSEVNFVFGASQRYLKRQLREVTYAVFSPLSDHLAFPVGDVFAALVPGILL